MVWRVPPGAVLYSAYAPAFHLKPLIVTPPLKDSTLAALRETETSWVIRVKLTRM
jgi:hypothetical protein